MAPQANQRPRTSGDNPSHLACSHTEPSIVRQAVTGLLSGQIKLSLANVGAILVLANATGIECLEATCVTFLGTRVHQMTIKSLLCLFKLGGHLGLHLLVLSTANGLVTLPWEQNMQALGHMAKSLDKMDKERLNNFVHHPERGAYSELQVLQLLEGIALAENDVAAYVGIDNMQPPELDTLLRILTNEQHAGQSVLLRNAVQSQLAKACKPPSELIGYTRFANIHMTDAPGGI